MTSLSQDTDFMGESETDCNFKLPEAKETLLSSRLELRGMLHNNASVVNQIGGCGTLVQTWTPDNMGDGRKTRRSFLRIAIPAFRAQQAKLRNQFRNEPNLTRDEVRVLFDEYLPTPISKSGRYTDAERLQIERNKAIRRALFVGQPTRK